MKNMKKIAGILVVILVSAGNLSLNAQSTAKSTTGSASPKDSTMMKSGKHSQMGMRDHKGMMMQGYGMRHIGRPGDMMAFSGGGHGNNMRGGQVMRTFDNIPNLTDKQKADIAKLRQDDQAKMQKLRESMQTEMKEARESHRKAMLNILTDDQKKWILENF
jgi:hypothetical protein